ncbi:MAG: gamma-glutamyltransferase, partial [Limnobacter sp.]|nr:gamma-glutamyltransferase [Limnobacter sp.]
KLANPGHDQVDLLKHTSHISVADAQGNWVSLTSSLNTSFGSKVTIPGTGIVMNNQMDDFAADPGTANIYGLVQGRANAVAPGKRPLSSMTPALVLQNGQPILTVGAAGGPLIINQVVQVIARHILGQMPLDEALNYPRLHHQWSPATLYVEKNFPQDLRQALQAKGHELKTLSFEGSTNAVGRQNGEWMAVSEPRMVQRNEGQE